MNDLRSLTSTFLLAFVIPAFGQAPKPVGAPAPDFGGATPLQWSVRMADSEMARRGDRLAWKEGGAARWDYTAGLFTLSLLKLNEQVPDPRYVKFAEQAIGSFLSPDGEIQGYKADDYNLDNINPGKTVLALYVLTKEDRYRKTAELLRKQFEKQPRTSDGGFWHKQRYPNQMWLDGLYMGSPFYAQYGKLFDEPSDFNDVAKQILTVSKHTYDPKSGLFYHGWDESKEQSWANKTTGNSSNFWGRAIGWYGMAMVDVLDFLPANHPARSDIIATLQKLAAGVLKHQDRQSGLWYQVMDQGDRKGNYLEATASSMFVYTLAKGVNRGYLSRDYVQAVAKGYDGILKKLIRTDDKGNVSLTQCCSVAGLGFTGANGKPRDGSFDYYVNEPVVENDLKGVGPFILAGIEMQQFIAASKAPNSSTEPTGKTEPKWDWRLYQTILARIKPPTFPARDFPITSYGAVVGGEADASEAIGSAIAACAKAGGGRVVVPEGVFLTGPIHLLSGVNLHLNAGATLKFKTDPNAYLPTVFTRFEGMEFYNLSPFIYAFGQQNIAITGEGVLDGQADTSNWWAFRTRGGTGARARLAKMVADDTPVEKRLFGVQDFMRPVFIQPYRCKNVLIEGVRIRRSPMWEINPVLCTNVTVRGVEIVSHGPNNDGCDPESSRDVLIEDCLFDTGDDCIAIKSGRNNDGRRVGVASENLIIRKCTMKDGHGGVTIGSEISGGCRNVFVEDCNMDSPNLDRVLRFKSNAVRGGVVENVFMRNITVGRVADAALQIDFAYEEGTNGIHRPVVRNVMMENVNVRETPRVLNVVGIPAGEISGVRVVNSTFKNVKRDDTVRQAADVKLVDCVVERAK
jgi:unsaturated rhamnogalacturonyl hydrolase